MGRPLYIFHNFSYSLFNMNHQQYYVPTQIDTVDVWNKLFKTLTIEVSGLESVIESGLSTNDTKVELSKKRVEANY